MCDFSLAHAKSRPAKVADNIKTQDFGRGTIGFIDPTDDATSFEEMTAICLLPGTEIAFEQEPKYRYPQWALAPKLKGNVAIFRQINKDNLQAHHDALEFPDGQIVLLTMLSTHQHAKVLQLPAQPKSEAEAKDQERLAIVG